MKNLESHKPQFTVEYVPFVKPEEYVIVYPHDNKRMLVLAKYLRRFFLKSDGITLNIVSDAAPRAAREMLIGNTNRYTSTLAEQEFAVTCKDGNLIFEGGHPAMVEKAVKWYMTLDRRVTVTAVLHGRDDDFRTSVSFDDGQYDLVWCDEFDGNFFDRTRFTQRRHMPNASENLCVLSGEGKTLWVEDGQLKMQAVSYSDENLPALQCALPECICTDDTMWWKYGYVEMRAKIPLQHGAWSAWWASSYCETMAGKTQDWKYLCEIDMFEVFGNETLVQPNIHKWYKNYAGTFTELFDEKGEPLRHNGYADMHNGEYNGQKIGEGDRTGLHIPYKKFVMPPEEKDGYHVYGFRWTPDEMVMSVDGDEYMRFDLNDNFDGLTDMEDFRKYPLHMIFNNWIYAPGGWMANERNCIRPEDLPVDYFIEYVRIYQKPGEGYVLDPGADKEI